MGTPFQWFRMKCFSRCADTFLRTKYQHKGISSPTARRRKRLMTKPWTIPVRRSCDSYTVGMVKGETRPEQQSCWGLIFQHLRMILWSEKTPGSLGGFSGFVLGLSLALHSSLCFPFRVSSYFGIASPYKNRKGNTYGDETRKGKCKDYHLIWLG